MAETLTLDSLRDMMAALGPVQPRQRCIVGFPLVGDDEFVRAESRGLWLVGATAWRRFEQVAAREAAPIDPLAVTRLMGIPVEKYDNNNPDHRRLALELYDALIKDCACVGFCVPDEMHRCRQIGWPTSHSKALKEERR